MYRWSLAKKIVLGIILLFKYFNLLFYLAYMEIGATNISAMIGPRISAMVTATNKFGIPYFSLADGSEGNRDVNEPPNVIYIFPDPADINHATIQILLTYGWSDVAVIYDNHNGGKPIANNIFINNKNYHFMQRI